jgi:AcrR family transcriptional regulator
MGLRERRKLEARRAISGAAMELFAAHGFDEVTIAAIADAAGVSKMTVTNHFPRKEDLVFDRAEEAVGDLAGAVAGRAAGEGPLAALRRDHAERLAAGDVTLGPPTAAFARLVRDSPVLAARLRELAELRERALGDALAAETGDDGPTPRVVAAQLASVHRVLFADSLRRVLAGERRAAIRETLGGAARAAFDLLEPSLGGYAVRSPPGGGR